MYMDYDLLQKIYNIKSFVGYTDEEIKDLGAGFESIPHTLYEIWKKSCLLCREILRMVHIQHGQKRHIRRLSD